MNLYRHDAPETSIEAAEALDVSRLESIVLQVIQESGEAGMISDEVRTHVAIEHGVHSYSSVTARYSELTRRGLISFTGSKRPGRSGRNQRVMIASEYQNEENEQLGMEL